MLNVSLHKWTGFLKGMLIVSALLVMACPAGAVEGEHGSCSLKAALKHTYQDNPTLNAARAELRATYESLPQAMAGWLPEIMATGDVYSTKIDGSNFGIAQGTTSKDIELSMTQPLFQGGQTQAEYDQAKHTIQAQRALLSALEQQVMLDVVVSYMDVYRDQGIVKLKTGNRDVLAKELDATNSRFRLGELTKTDVAQAEARLARADAELIVAEGNLETSRAVYEQVVGKTLEDEVIYGDIYIELPENMEVAKTDVLNTNPDLKAVEALHLASKEEIGKTFAELLPALQLYGSWNRVYDPQPGIISENTTRTVGLSASIPLYQGGAIHSRVRQAKHLANQKLLETFEMKRRVKQTLVRHWQTWKAAAAEIKSRETQVHATEIAREGVQKEKMLGGRTVLDALDADQELLDSRVALVTAKRNEIVARFSLASVLGLLTPKNLGFLEAEIDYDNEMKHIKWKFWGTNVDIDGY